MRLDAASELKQIRTYINCNATISFRAVSAEGLPLETTLAPDIRRSVSSIQSTPKWNQDISLSVVSGQRVAIVIAADPNSKCQVTYSATSSTYPNGDGYAKLASDLTWRELGGDVFFQLLAAP